MASGGQRKLWANGRLRRYVGTRLAKAWSPDQIARCRLLDYADDAGMQISAKAVYRYIYVLPRGELKAMLIKGLRQEHRYRRCYKAAPELAADGMGRTSDMLSIEE